MMLDAENLEVNVTECFRASGGEAPVAGDAKFAYLSFPRLNTACGDMHYERTEFS